MKSTLPRDDRVRGDPWWAREEPAQRVIEEQLEEEDRKMMEKSACRSVMEKLWEVVGPAIILLLVWLAFSAWNFIAASALSTGINALALTLERELLSLPFMLSFAIYQDGRLMVVGREHVPLLLLVALCSCLNIVCATFALDYLPSGVVSVAELTVGILTVLMCWLFRVERGSKLKLFSVIVATTGAMIVQYRYDKDGGFNSDPGKDDSSLWWVGAILVCGQVIAAAGLATGLPTLVIEYSPWSITFWYYLIATILTGGMCLLTHTSLNDFFLGKKAQPWFALIYGTLVVSTFCWMALSWAIRRMMPSCVMATIATQPISTYMLALAVHGHPKLSAFSLSGMAVVLWGLLMVIFAQKRERDLDEEERFDSLRGETKPLLGGDDGEDLHAQYMQQQRRLQDGEYVPISQSASHLSAATNNKDSSKLRARMNGSGTTSTSASSDYAYRKSYMNYNSRRNSRDANKMSWEVLDGDDNGDVVDDDEERGRRQLPNAVAISGNGGGGGGHGDATSTSPATSSSSSWWEAAGSSKGSKETYI